MSDEILEMLKKIDGKLDRLESRVDSIENEKLGLVNDGLSILSDSVDDHFNPQNPNGLNNLDKINKVQKIMSNLTSDDTLKALTQMSENLKNIADLTVKVQQTEDVISIMLDSFDDFFQKAMEQGLDIEDFMSNLKRFSFLMLDAFESGAFNELMDSGILDPSSIKTVGALGKSMATSGKMKNSAGPVSLVSAIFNPEIQRSLGFLLTFATHFGRSLKSQRTLQIEKS